MDAAAARQRVWAEEQLAEHPATDLLVLGHTHRAALVEVAPGRHYLNPGAWFDGFRYAVASRASGRAAAVQPIATTSARPSRSPMKRAPTWRNRASSSLTAKRCAAVLFRGAVSLALQHPRHAPPSPAPLSINRTSGPITRCSSGLSSG